MTRLVKIDLAPTRGCPGNCDTQIAFERLICEACWWTVPPYLRDAVNATYAARQRNGSDFAAAYGHRIAIRRVLAYLRERREATS